MESNKILIIEYESTDGLQTLKRHGVSENMPIDQVGEIIYFDKFAAVHINSFVSYYFIG